MCRPGSFLFGKKGLRWKIGWDKELETPEQIGVNPSLNDPAVASVKGSSGSTASIETPVARSAKRWPAALASLSDGNARLLFRGTFAPQIGFQMQQIALAWLILDLTNSPFYLGLNAFFFMFPMLVVAPFSGVIVDRLSRRRVLMFSQATLMVISVVLALSVYLGSASVWQLMIISLMTGIAFSFQVPARQALLTELVDRDLLANGITLWGASLNSASIIGPAVAGWLITVATVAECFLFQGASCIWSIAHVWAIKLKRQVSVATSESPLRNLMEGWRYCYRSKTVFTMLLTASISTVFVMSTMVFLTDYARTTLGQGAGGLGILVSAAGVGGLLGSVGLAIAGRLPKRGLVALGAVGTAGALLALAATFKSVVPAMLALAGIAACGSTVMVLTQSIIQEFVPDGMRGRAMGVYMMTWGLMPLGSLPLGAIAGSFGTPTAMMVGGLSASALAVVMMILRPEVHRI